MGGYMSSDVESIASPEILPTHLPDPEDRHVVVIPVDASPEAEKAFDYYLRHIHRPENTVHILHIQEMEHPSGKNFPDYVVTPEAIHDKVAEAAIRGDTILQKYGDRLRALEIESQMHSHHGRPGPTVIGMANRLEATMIVMGTRGMGVISRTILGSVSQYVVNHTRIPVTVIPTSRGKPSSWF